MSADVLVYVQPNGQIGVRNLVAVLSAMDNANPAANRVGASAAGTVVLSTPFGRTQIGYDTQMTTKALAQGFDPFARRLDFIREALCYFKAQT